MLTLKPQNFIHMMHQLTSKTRKFVIWNLPETYFVVAKIYEVTYVVFKQIGAVISAHGCWVYSRQKTGQDIEEGNGFLTIYRDDNVDNQTALVTTDTNIGGKLEEKRAGTWGYCMQIIYQVGAPNTFAKRTLNVVEVWKHTRYERSTTSIAHSFRKITFITHKGWKLALSGRHILVGYTRCFKM